ncbi:MAG: response regulator [Candidatus Sericytochromatia bacterium]
MPIQPYLLIADDDEDDCFLINEALREFGFPAPTRFVANGQELLSTLEGENFNGLVLLDLNMPLMDGREALHKIKQNQALRHVPVVILTTSNSPEDIQLTYTTGCSGYVTKPNSFQDLVHMLHKLSDYWFHTVKLPRAHA